MILIWTNKKEYLQRDGIHIYDHELLKKIMIPYANGKLIVKRTIYIHDMESDKKYDVVERNQNNKKLVENILEKVFANVECKKK